MRSGSNPAPADALNLGRGFHFQIKGVYNPNRGEYPCGLWMFRKYSFVRPKRGDPFVFLGPLHYVSHTGSRPMSIYWDLEHPMPAWFFEICGSLRAA